MNPVLDTDAATITFRWVCGRDPEARNERFVARWSEFDEPARAALSRLRDRFGRRVTPAGTVYDCAHVMLEASRGGDDWMLLEQIPGGVALHVDELEPEWETFRFSAALAWRKACGSAAR